MIPTQFTHFELYALKMGPAEIAPRTSPKYTRLPIVPIETLSNPSSLFKIVVAAGMAPWSTFIKIFKQKIRRKIIFLLNLEKGRWVERYLLKSKRRSSCSNWRVFSVFFYLEMFIRYMF